MNCSIETIPVGSDNYSYVVSSGSSALAIDTSDAEPILEYLESRGLELKYILSTHAHSDHTGGNRVLKEKTSCTVAGGDEKIAAINSVLTDNDTVSLGSLSVKALLVPGHTRKQMAYYIESLDTLFTGDTLFGAGCGRIFECGPEHLYQSLEKLSGLPDVTRLYFGHEYTLDNLSFALTVEPDNNEINIRRDSVKSLLSSGLYSTPSTLVTEKQTNPFLRVHSKTIRQTLKMLDRSPVAVFAELRKRKDRF